MNQIKIISIFNKHEDFIKLQYNSIKKHVNGDYEYIVFNNASNEEQANKIKTICEDLNIKCFRINVDYNMDPSNIAGEALNQSFAYLKDEIVFKIDSDMFFISNVNLVDICNENNLFYIETHNKFMWSGVFSVNLKKIKDVNLNFRPNVINNTDTFGQSVLLTDNQNNTRKKMYLYCVLDESNGVIEGLINNDCRINISKTDVIFIENDRYEILYNSLKDKFFSVYDKIIEYNFPKPYHIDIITLDGADIIIHFKSSNHDNIYLDLEYTKNKKIALENFLNNN